MDYHCREDWYEPDPNKIDKCFCGICGDEMLVERNHPPSGGFAGAMANHNRYYDIFRCPHRKLDWHVQAKALLREIDKTPSNCFAEIMREEAREILKNRKATKEIK